MLRWLINYFRSCFCQHDFELIKQVNIYDEYDSKLPIGTRWVYRCKRCCYYKVIKDY